MLVNFFIANAAAIFWSIIIIGFLYWCFLKLASMGKDGDDDKMNPKVTLDEFEEKSFHREYEHMN